MPIGWSGREALIATNDRWGKKQDLTPSSAVAWLECRLIPERHTEDAYDTCFAEVVAAAADERVFAGGHWQMQGEGDAALRTIHHLGAGNFVRAGGMWRVGAG